MRGKFFTTKKIFVFSTLFTATVGAFLFSIFGARAGTITNAAVAPAAANTDDLSGQTNAQWKFTMTTASDLTVGKVVQVIFPTITYPGGLGPQFTFSSPAITATTSAYFDTSVALNADTRTLGFTVVNSTIAGGTTFSITVNGVANPLSSLYNLANLSWTFKTGTAGAGGPAGADITVIDGPATATRSLIRAGYSMYSSASSTIALSSYTASDTGVTATFRFVATSSLASGGKIALNFPTGFVLTSATAAAQSDINGTSANAPQIAEGAIAADTANGANRVILTTSNAAIAAGDTVTVAVGGITNPVAGVYQPFFIYTTTANGGLIDGSPTPDGTNDTYGGPPPVSSVHIGGNNNINVSVYKDTGSGTTTLSAADIAQIRIGVGCPDKQFFVGNRYLSPAGTTTFSNLLDCNYKIGVEGVGGNSKNLFDRFLKPGMVDVPAIGGGTKNVALTFGVPDTVWTGTITGGVAAASSVYLQAFNGQYETWMPVFTDTNYTTNGFDGSGNAYFYLRLKTGSSWKVNFLGGVLTSGANKYWPPVISSTYASSTATTSLGTFAYQLADKVLTVTLKNGSTGETISSNTCVGVKRTGGGMFMGSQETYCNANSGTNYVFKVPSGDITIEVMRPGVGKPEEYPLAVSADTAKTIYISAPTSYISVSVLDSGGTVINGAPVFAHSSSGGNGQGMTNSSGAATIYVPAGTYSVDGFAPGLGPLTPQTAIVTNSSNPSVTFTVNTASLKTISGSVTQGGAGVGGVQIGARGVSGTTGGNGTVTNADGTYTLRVPAGIYKVGGWSQSTGGLQEQNANVSSSNATVNFSLSASGTLVITVTGAANISSLFGGAFDPTTGRGNGTDVWTTIGNNKVATTTLPAGTYEVHVGSPITGEISTAGDTVTIEGGVTATKSYAITSVATLATLSGSVTSGGVAVANANVWVSRVGGPGFFSTLTNSSGAYSISLPSGYTYKVGVKKLGYLTANTETSVSADTTQDFSLTSAGSTITGTVTSGSTAIANAWVSAKKTNADTWTGAPTDAAGNYSLDVDADSTWTLYAEGPCYLRSTGTSASAGDTGKNISLTSRSDCSLNSPEVHGVTGSTGGLVNNGEKIKIDIPANALGTDSNTVSISIQDADLVTDSANVTPLKRSVQSIVATNSSGQTVTSLNSKVTITLIYNDSDLPPGFNEANLRFGYKDSTTGQWEPIAATVDTDLNTITAQVDHFTDDGLLLPDVPAAPENLWAAAASSAQINITWNTVTGATSYNVYRSTTSGGTFIRVGSPTSASYSDTGLTSGTTYYYKITAVNSNGSSVYSDEISAATSQAQTTGGGGGSSGGGGGGSASIVSTATPSPSPSPSVSPSASPEALASPAPSPAAGSASRAEGTLVRYENDTKVYVIEGNKKRWIPTAETFNKLGYDWAKIAVISSSETYAEGVNKSLATGVRTDGSLIRYANDTKVYVIEGNKKRWIPDAATFSKLGYSWGKVAVIDSSESYEAGQNKTSGAAAAQSSVSTSGKTFSKLLRLGMKDEQVRLLQEKLKQLGFFPADSEATGYFGKTTKEAVIKFQKQFGIDQIGHVGPQTRVKLNEK